MTDSINLDSSLEKSINVLFEKFGFYVYNPGFYVRNPIDETNGFEAWSLLNSKNKYVYGFDSQLGYQRALIENSLEKLWMAITQHANVFYLYDQYRIASINNPYFGCQSLEEAFIKKDLLENDPN